jgi:hypothetical protein
MTAAESRMGTATLREALEQADKLTALSGRCYSVIDKSAGTYGTSFSVLHYHCPYMAQVIALRHLCPNSHSETDAFAVRALLAKKVIRDYIHISLFHHIIELHIELIDEHGDRKIQLGIGKAARTNQQDCSNRTVCQTYLRP